LIKRFPDSQSDLPMKKTRRVETAGWNANTLAVHETPMIEGYRRQVKKRFRGLSASKNEDATRTSLDPAIYLPLTVSGHD
jgi:hypothetical protein